MGHRPETVPASATKVSPVRSGLPTPPSLYEPLPQLFLRLFRYATSIQENSREPSIRSTISFFASRFHHKAINMRLVYTLRSIQFQSVRISCSRTTSSTNGCSATPQPRLLILPFRQVRALPSLGFRGFHSSIQLPIVKPFLLADIGEGSLVRQIKQLLKAWPFEIWGVY